MANIGAEVSQKMRSAIKAKLLELNCYVDDELPDYIMVMVANKRTKSQMKEDLQLFLSAKTAAFVDWLHIVLKKLKEVTVTNPDIYKKTVKRKLDEAPNINVKKEKKKPDKKSKKSGTSDKSNISEDSVVKSLTDDLPINANRLSEQRKIIIMKENKSNNSTEVMQDNFDIPLLSEVTMSTEAELEDLERKIKSVKSRLGLLVESEGEEDCINLKSEPDEQFFHNDAENNKKDTAQPSNAEKSQTPPRRSERTRITFDSSELEATSPKKKSVLERLGKRRSNESHDDSTSSSKRSRRSVSDFRNEDNKKSRRSKDLDKSKESVLNRLGVMSKVSIPSKPPEEPEVPFISREVPSMIKVKPRNLPPKATQPNKTLLLKAVADAQRSVAQTPKVGSTLKPDALFTKNYKEKAAINKNKDSNDSQTKGNNYTEEDLEYIPAPVKSVPKSIPKYIPSVKSVDETQKSQSQIKQQFIVTLDGIEKTKFKDLLNNEEKPEKPSIKSRLDKKKSPSPIIFDKVDTSVATKSNIPDKLPIVHPPTSIKNKERCKYWPTCRQGDKCEFVHPTTNCEKFPRCKFGDRCLYLHPSCKFGSSCTRRDCTYSHLVSRSTSSTPAKILGQVSQICKFFPNCTNSSCTFFHPKPCKFGKYCKNQVECTFSHNFIPSKSSLTWRPKN